MDIIFFPSTWMCVWITSILVYLHVCVCVWFKVPKPACKTENFPLVMWLLSVILSRTYWNAVSGLLSLKSAQTVCHYLVITGQNLIRINKGMTKLRKLYSEMHCVHYIWCILRIIFLYLCCIKLQSAIQDRLYVSST